MFEKKIENIENESFHERAKESSSFANENEETSDEIEINDEEFDIIMIKKIKISCKCRNINENLFKKLRWKNADAADMQSDMNCIATLKKLMKSVKHDDDLFHVCHEHLHVLFRHFRLQIKRLRISQLRSRLKLIWNNRSNLNEFKIQHFTWFRFIERSFVKIDLHDVYVHRLVRKNLKSTIIEESRKMILSKIVDFVAWKKWNEKKI